MFDFSWLRLIFAATLTSNPNNLKKRTMIIGVPKEIKNNENRIAVTPAGVKELVANGHTVYVQAGGGLGSGFTDEEYISAGAKMLPAIEDVYEIAEMIIKVKEPIEPEYKLIKKGGRASEFENAIEWLCLSGIASQVYKVEQVKKPLENYRNIDAFKIYVSDLGLLCAKKDLAANDILYMVEEINDFKGGMAENYVNVQLTINGYNTYYWESERGAEIDFIIQRDGRLIPIEVKSADNTRAKSLKVYMDTYKPDYAIKLSSKNFGFEDNKKIVPLYAAFCI